jgi:uncharacterized protein (TIGR02598 family)
MRIACGQLNRETGTESGFTIVEVVLAMAIAGVMFVALYSGLMGGFMLMRMARENTRATQILLEKMETIRLYTWDQINDSNFVASTFTTPYYPVSSTNQGIVYYGTLTVNPSTQGTSYDDDMRRVTVTLDWNTGTIPRTRSISTYVSRYGLQNYIYF